MGDPGRHGPELAQAVLAFEPFMQAAQLGDVLEDLDRAEQGFAAPASELVLAWTYRVA
jgi:hypothetical protein